MNTPKFEFTKYDIDIEIAGKSFVLDCTSDTGDYLSAQAEVLRGLADEIGNGTKTGEDAVRCGTEIINHVLGNGATAKIFDGRKIRFSDISDICLFLARTVRDFNDEHKRGASGAPGKK